MARVFITGSADGLGKMAAQILVTEGHEVVLHARNEKRVAEALAAVPGAAGAISGDLASIAAVKEVAAQVNERGQFDAVIHNAAIGYREGKRVATEDGLPQVFAINSLAPYILTCLIRPPQRLVYLSSGLHQSGDAGLQDLTWSNKAWSGFQAYADSKLHDALLAFAVARKWPSVLSNAVEPGWVATKMGGAGAPDSLEQGPETQAWLAVSEEAEANVSGQYFYHRKRKAPLPAVKDAALQEGFLSACEALSGVSFPAYNK
jgi:NAD(P)-dependent dehydrogenase (short-subunit alcohol dehydrogenase family)